MNDHPSPIERLRSASVSPDRSLGQNFLIDPNIVDVIERTAGLDSGDVVLEVGPGLGVLTERLLQRCGTVHCIELDEELAQTLARQFASAKNLRLLQGDAMKTDLASLEPAPDKFVSNLPYNVAAPMIARSFEQLPSVEFWCLMLQKEVADRLFAAPGSAEYGSLSVMVQLMAEKVSARTVSGNVFYPRPRVRSSLLAFRRSIDGPVESKDFGPLRDFVQACFSHRRKTLINSLAEADRSLLSTGLSRNDRSEIKAAAARALESLGLSESARPQSLLPSQYLDLARILQGKSGD